MRLSTPAPFAILAALSLLTLPIEQVVYAQDDGRGLRIQQGSQTERRIALVIGNSAYKDFPLTNPVNDARDMAATLQNLGFEVIQGADLTKRDMEGQIRLFGSKIREGGVGLFYYAGHGIQLNGANYLIPIGANVTIEEELKYESVDVGLVLAQMENARNNLNIVVLDACRNNPFARSFRSVSGGLASIDAPRGTLIAYATAPGSIAKDGDRKNGTYTEELLRYIRTPGLSIEQVFKRVRVAVVGRTNGTQTPWESSSLVGDFYFSRSSPPVKSSAVTRLLDSLGGPNVEVIDTLTVGRELYVLYSEELNSGRWVQNPDGTRFLQCDVYVAKIDGQMNVKTLKLSTIYGLNNFVGRTNIGIARTHGAIDADADGVTVFVIEKEDTKDYGMTGFLYQISPSDLTLRKKETMFTRSNMGWFPTIKDGIVTHFSYAGWVLMRGVREAGRYEADTAVSVYSAYRFKKISVASDRNGAEYPRLAIQYIAGWQ